MPPKGTRKSVHHHDKPGRHENGLVPPAARIHRAGSNGNLSNGGGGSGGPNGKPAPHHQPVSVSSRASGVAVSHASGEPSSSLLSARKGVPNGAASAAATAATTSTALASRSEFTATSSSSQLGNDSRLPSGFSDEQQHFLASRNGSMVGPGGGGGGGGASSMGGFQRNNSGISSVDLDANNAFQPAMGLTDIMRLATTIVSTCPLYDVIAILIILLQLPPTLLTIINALFACLTFIPPTTGTTLSALPSFSDMYAGSGGATSIVTVAFLDVTAMFGWIFLWVPAQHFAIDLAQVVIAISLGGAAASRGAITHVVMICLGIVLPYHAFQFNMTRRLFFKAASFALSKAGVKQTPYLDPATTVTRTSGASSPNLVQAIVGVHILTQGVVKLTKRGLSLREFGSASHPTKKTRPEANGGSRPNGHEVQASLAVEDLSGETSTPPHSDNGSSGPATGRQDGRDSAANRRKKMRINNVRSRQPFWSAIANAKVTVLKSMEAKLATLDAEDASTLGADRAARPNAGFKSGVWITKLEATGVGFRVLVPRGDASAERQSAVPAGIDASLPLYVRVNGAAWSSTRIREAESNYANDGASSVWEGEIYGLTPMSNFLCEFVSTPRDKLIYSAYLSTRPTPNTSQTATAPSPSHQSLRPSSPKTTLRNSIAAAEKNLEDQKERAKQQRKLNKASLQTFKKELDTLKSKVSSSGGNDDKTRNRITQLNSNMRQAEDDSEEISRAIKELEVLPDAQRAEHQAIKAKWQQTRSRKDDVASENERLKAESEQQISALKSEIANTLQKREKLIARQGKLNEQEERLLAAKNQDRDARTRREKDRAAQAAGRAQIEANYVSGMATQRRLIQELEYKITQAAQQINQMQQYDAANQPQQRVSLPPSPESMAPPIHGPAPGPGRVPGVPGLMPYHFPAMNSQFNNDAFRANSTAPPPGSRDGRIRSSSMFSDGYAYAEDRTLLPSTSGNVPMGAVGQIGAGGGGGGVHKSNSNHHPVNPRRTGSKASSGSGGSPRDQVGSPRPFSRTPPLGLGGPPRAASSGSEYV